MDRLPSSDEDQVCQQCLVAFDRFCTNKETLYGTGEEGGLVRTFFTRRCKEIAERGRCTCNQLSTDRSQLNTMTIPETPPRDASLSARLLKSLLQIFDSSQQSVSEEEIDQSLSMDETVNLLRQGRRRVIIEQLATTDQRRTSVADLAEDVACTEYECTPAELGSDERKRVYIALQQSHLPQLNDADVVLYDSNATLVSKGPNFQQLRHAQLALRDALPNNKESY